MYHKRMLHFNNYAITGGVPSFITTIAMAFPEFEHVVCSLKEPEEYALIDYWRNMGIKYMHHNKITRDIVKDMGARIITLHNIRKNQREGRWSYDIFFDRAVIFFHHNQCIVPDPHHGASLHCYVSEYIKKTGFVYEPNIVMPPCVYEVPYLKINRPHREKPVIGRIQSQTCGKISDDMVRLLGEINGADTYTVGTGNAMNPIVPGKMPEHLQKIDMLAMWSNRVESWSMVTTEAMLSGIPVVAFNRCDGLAEQMRKSKGGLLVNTRQGFKEALQYLVDHPDKRKELGEIGRNWAVRNASSRYLRNRLIDKILDWV